MNTAIDRASVSSTAILTNRAVLNAAALAFVAGNAIWATGLAWPAMVAVLAGCCGVAGLLFSGRGAPDTLLDAPVNAGLLLSCIVLGFVLVVLGGEGHIFYSVDDWLTRDAVLADIVRHGARVFYKIGDEAFYLRAPLGMYMIPGVVGELFGLQSAHLALLTQNALLLAAIFYLAGSLSSGRVLVYLLILYGGFDLLPWGAGVIRDRLQTGDWAFPVGIGWWAIFFQYTDHFTAICFVPNHAIPGWFIAVLAILVARRALDIATLGAVFAALLLWSPLAPLAAIPLLIYFAWRDIKFFTEARVWLGVAAGACFLPVAFYLVGGAEAIHHGALLNVSGFWPTYFTFLLVELPHVLFLAALWPRVRAELKPVLLIAVAMLALLPLYSFGPGNDLAMRGATAPLFLVAFAFASVFLGLEPSQKVARALGVFIIVIGAAKAIVSFNIAIFANRFSASACNLVTASQQLNPASLPTNYINPASRAPGWLVRAPGPDAIYETIGGDWCWPDHPVFNSAEKIPPVKPMPH